MFEADTVSFIGGLEAVYLQPGDIFAVSDEVRNVGRTFGRILDVDASANTIKIDGEFQTGLASGIYIHVPSGNYAVSDLNYMTGSDGGFTGTLEQIRARRQKQIRKFNIHTVQDDSYGATITVTGDFLLKSAKTEVYPIEGRISGGGVITGETVLTGVVYALPDHTVLNGNPKWDTVTYADVTGVFSQNNIDITISGSGGTGQLVSGLAAVPNWTGEINFNASTSSTLSINGVVTGTSSSNEIRMFRISAAGAVEASGAISDLNDFWTNSVYTAADADEVVLVYTRGNQLSNTFSPSVTWATGAAATEVFRIGDDIASSSSTFGYAGVFVKNGYRILERASKGNSETGKIKFTYRDLLAFSRLRPFYTIVQADVGNRQESVFPEWEAGRAYSVGNKVKVTNAGVSVPYVCTRSHERSSQLFTSDYDAGSTARSKWAIGNNLGYSTIGFPKDFYGSSKVYLNTTLTSSHISSAFAALDIDVYVGGGTLGQSDIANLAESNGLGYSGLVIGTGYPRGFYDLDVDTLPKNLTSVQEGSLYVLSGSGVEPKLYKTIGVKE